MRLKKHIARAMALAMVFSLTAVTAPAMKAIPVMAGEESGGEPTTKKTIEVTIDYHAYAAEIASEYGDKYFFVEVLKDKDGKKVANTYCYPAPEGNLYLDLSFLKADKEQYIRVYGDVTTEKSDVKTISARPSKLKIKFTPQYKSGVIDLYSSLAVSVGGSTVTLNEDNVGQYVIRGLYASPFSCDTLDVLANGGLEQLMVSGNTLLVSKDAMEDTTKGTDGAPASAEVKVKISAIPKAPKVTTDYVKGVVKFAKNAQIRLVYLAAKDATETTEQTEWKDLSSTSLTPEDILKAAGVTDADVIAANVQKGFKIIVRTKADGKKAASALTFVNVDGQLQAAQTKDTESNLKNEITVQVDKDTTAKLTWTATETGVTFKAEKADFQYVENGKTKKLAKDKEVKVKFTGKKTFTVSLAGLKSTKTTTGYFASNTVNIEVEQVYPAAKTPTATTEGNVVTVTSDDLKLVFTRTSDTAVTVSGDTSKFEIKTTGDYATATSSLEVSKGAQTITVRVAKGEKNAASEAATVTIPAYTAPAEQE